MAYPNSSDIFDLGESMECLLVIPESREAAIQRQVSSSSVSSRRRRRTTGTSNTIHNNPVFPSMQQQQNFHQYYSGSIEDIETPEHTTGGGAERHGRSNGTTTASSTLSSTNSNANSNSKSMKDIKLERMIHEFSDFAGIPLHVSQMYLEDCDNDIEKAKLLYLEYIQNTTETQQPQPEQNLTSTTTTSTTQERRRDTPSPIPTVECDKCSCAINILDILSLDGCDHLCCKGCAEKTIREEISRRRNITDIPCPCQCGSKLHQHEIKKVLGEDEYDLVTSLLLEQNDATSSTNNNTSQRDRYDPANNIFSLHSSSPASASSATGRNAGIAQENTPNNKSAPADRKICLTQRTKRSTSSSSSSNSSSQSNNRIRGVVGPLFKNCPTLGCTHMTYWEPQDGTPPVCVCPRCDLSTCLICGSFVYFDQSLNCTHMEQYDLNNNLEDNSDTKSNKSVVSQDGVGHLHREQSPYKKYD